MNVAFGRTQNFSKRIAIEREVLAAANLLSERLSCDKLFGLNDAAIVVWISSLSNYIDSAQLSTIEHAVRELARGTGLLSDESRCAVAEGKVSADFPELLTAVQNALDDVSD
ncbi:hypothetical protein [uncultured Ruegeria sp.]|uniref:hypothetical protein n=1 Tax=uncultured Ruegeria sp. TaxID=259304 RepID=UPI00262795CA|nr:hypothetical protein [uncultured Ruegeria sp.]